jgi:hypothetical protein
MRITIKLVACLAVFAWLSTSDAPAAFKVKIEELNVKTGAVLATATIQDNVFTPLVFNTNDQDVNAGSIIKDTSTLPTHKLFGINNLSFKLTVTSNSPGDTIDNGLLASTRSDITNQTGSAIRFRITTTDTGFIIPGPGNSILSSIVAPTVPIGTTTKVKGTFESFVANNNLEFQTSGPTVTASGTMAIQPGNNASMTPFNQSSPYSLTTVLDITIANSTRSSLTDSASVAAVVPVPPALALLASGIPFALVYLRRRKQA